MTLQVTPTQLQIQTVLSAFLRAVVPTVGFVVVQGQANRVPEPEVADFAVMTPMARERLSTNHDVYTDTPPSGNNTYSQSTKLLMQVDVHGPNASDNAQIISTMFRDEYATTFFSQQSASTFPVGWTPLAGISPLYADDPKQVPFINAEQQWEYRWIVEAYLQVDQVVSNVPQQFAATLKINVESVTVEFSR